MDKIGISSLAGNQGIPATPRDGAPVELTALLFVGLSFVCDLIEANLFEFEGVLIN